MTAYGWDHPLTARRYAAFCDGPTRYQFANQALVRAAELGGAQQVLDFAAGLGHTAEAALALLGADAKVLCVEPAAAMRSAGRERLRDPRVRWADELPTQERFDRVLCGAALWQTSDLGRLRGLLADDGLLCFSIPSLYLGIPDRPGGGDDPLLHAFWAKLAAARTAAAEPTAQPQSEEELLRSLADLGLSPVLLRLEYRLTQSELRDWVKIPVLTDALFPDLDAEERDHRIDRAHAAVDAEAFRFEGWSVVVARVGGVLG